MTCEQSEELGAVAALRLLFTVQVGGFVFSYLQKTQNERSYYLPFSLSGYIGWTPEPVGAGPRSGNL